MRKVLIVVDMQNDFITGALGSQMALDIIPNVLHKCEEARRNQDMIIFTKDLHYKEDYCELLEGAYVPPHCLAESNGHWILPELAPYADYRVVKNTYAYQYWGEWRDAFEQVKYIELIGVCTDICVISNALLLRSMYPSIPICVDASCCAGSKVYLHDAALEVMKSCNVEVINE